MVLFHLEGVAVVLLLDLLVEDVVAGVGQHHVNVVLAAGYNLRNKQRRFRTWNMIELTP